MFFHGSINQGYVFLISNLMQRHILVRESIITLCVNLKLYLEMKRINEQICPL